MVVLSENLRIIVYFYSFICDFVGIMLVEAFDKIKQLYNLLVIRHIATVILFGHQLRTKKYSKPLVLSNAFSLFHKFQSDIGNAEF